MKQLHILNGDSTRTLFDQTEIEGDVFVWREMLCSGPCINDVGSSSFFEMRDEFIRAKYDASENDYYKSFANTFKDIIWSDYEEFILWFEYDLFCFINLLAAISFLKSKNLKSRVSLVDVSKQQKENRFVGLGEMTSSAYPGMYKARQVLNDNTMALADQIWSCYCSDDHSKLQQFMSVTNPVFPKLHLVLETHFQRLATSASLAQIDLDILQFIKDSTPTTLELVGHMLRKSDKLGMGDLQWHWHVNQLESLYDRVDEQLILNQLGNELLSDSANLQNFISEVKHIYNYRYGLYKLNKVFLLT